MSLLSFDFRKKKKPDDKLMSTIMYIDKQKKKKEHERVGKKRTGIKYYTNRLITFDMTNEVR